MSAECVLYRCTFQCLCGHTLVLRTDDPLRMNGMNVTCPGCGLPLGRILTQSVPVGYNLRLKPHHCLLQELRSHHHDPSHRPS